MRPFPSSTLFVFPLKSLFLLCSDPVTKPPLPCRVRIPLPVVSTPAPVRSKLMRVAETRPRRLHRSGNSLSGSSDSRSPDSGKRGRRGVSPPPAS